MLGDILRVCTVSCLMCIKLPMVNKMHYHLVTQSYRTCVPKKHHYHRITVNLSRNQWFETTSELSNTDDRHLSFIRSSPSYTMGYSLCILGMPFFAYFKQLLNKRVRMWYHGCCRFVWCY
jgi:hypothetical protein